MVSSTPATLAFSTAVLVLAASGCVERLIHDHSCGDGRLSHGEVCLGEGTRSTIVIDSLVDVFAGKENDRTQVRQFISILRSFARTTNCAMVLISHPSLTGMNTGTGLSGSTDWHNAVRARMYLSAIKTKDGDEPDGQPLRQRLECVGREHHRQQRAAAGGQEQVARPDVQRLHVPVAEPGGRRRRGGGVGVGVE